MSVPVDRGFEAEGFTVRDIEGGTGQKAGFYSGDGDPWIVVPDAPNGSVYAKTDGTVYTLNGTAATSTDWHQNSEAVVWRNLWQAGTYNKNEMVRDGDWTMIANKQTTDRASPIVQGEPGFALPDVPSWTNVSESTPRITGARFTVIADSVLVDGLRVWVENTDANTEYFVQLIDITDGANEKIFEDGPIDNTVQGWIEIAIGQRVFTAGQTFDARVFQLKQTPASEFTHTWTSLSHFTTPADPGSGNWARDDAFTKVTISKTDNTVTDRSADLATLGIGDALNFEESSDPRRAEKCAITAVTDQGTWIEYDVGLDFIDREIRSNRNTDVNGVNLGVPSNVDIPRLNNFWLDFDEVDGFDVTDETTIGANLDDNAYGVDVRFAPVDVSPDWDLVAFLGTIPVIGGGGTVPIIQNDGVPLAGAPHTTVDYTGAGVTASDAGGGKAEVAVPGNPPSDLPAVQARKTITQVFTTSFVDAPFEVTDFENDDTVVEHDNVLRDRILLKQAGPYFVRYQIYPDVVPDGGSSHNILNARVRVNDAGVEVPGSLSQASAGEDSSLVGDATFAGQLIAGFIYDASANDFLTVQIIKTETSGSNVINAEAAMWHVMRMTGATGPQGAPGSGGSTIRVGKTYAVAGEIKVPVGQTDFIAPFFVSLAAGQTAKLVKARYQINTGTSVTAKLTKNGVDVPGFTAISVTTTEATTDPTDVVLADDDEIALVVTAVSGTPQNLSFTIFIEHTG